MNKWKKYKTNNPDKIKAHNIALYVHKEQQPCSINGCEDKAERHHPDYKQPDKIIWFCRKHHIMIHGKSRGICKECDRPHHAKGLCKIHYASKFRKQQGW